ncbi:MAG: shikimate kinase [Pirellulales bacterium]
MKADSAKDSEVAEPPRCVALIGFRGTGKSAVGRRLAQRLGWTWIDTDREIVRRSGQTIAQLFASSGESGFRDWESQVLADLPVDRSRVVSLGGGAILRAENRERVCGWGPVVWLQADADTLEKRIAGDPSSSQDRPRLSDLALRDEIRQKLLEREPLYRECATWRLDTGRLSVDRVVSQIVKLLQSGAGNRE